MRHGSRRVRDGVSEGPRRASRRDQGTSVGDLNENLPKFLLAQMPLKFCHMGQAAVREAPGRGKGVVKELLLAIRMRIPGDFCSPKYFRNSATLVKKRSGRGQEGVKEGSRKFC